MTAAPEKPEPTNHLYGIVNTDEVNFDIEQFEKLALTEIEGVVKMGCTPLIVGGTNYYIERILFEKSHEAQTVPLATSIQKEYKSIKDFEEDFFAYVSDAEKKGKYKKEQAESLALCHQVVKEMAGAEKPGDKMMPSEILKKNKIENGTLYELFGFTDPLTQSYYHPNDTRRILNFMCKFYRTFERESDLRLKEKLKLRYKNACCIWIRASPSVLKDRVDKRTEQMLKVINIYMI